MSQRHQKAMYSPFLHEHLSMRKLCHSVCRVCSINPKQQCVDDSERCFQLFQRNKKKFLRKYLTMDETWTYHFPPPRSQIGSQLSGQQQVKAVQSDQRHKHLQARFWPPYFGMRKVFCSLIALRKEEPSKRIFYSITMRLTEEIA